MVVNEPEDCGVGKYLFAAAILGLTLLVGAKAPKDFIEHYTVFVLACGSGDNGGWGVTHSLHTPLMAVTNAISGIIVAAGPAAPGSSVPLYPPGGGEAGKLVSSDCCPGARVPVVAASCGSAGRGGAGVWPPGSSVATPAAVESPPA